MNTTKLKAYRQLCNEHKFPCSRAWNLLPASHSTVLWPQQWLAVLNLPWLASAAPPDTYEPWLNDLLSLGSSVWNIKMYSPWCNNVKDTILHNYSLHHHLPPRPGNHFTTLLKQYASLKHYPVTQHHFPKEGSPQENVWLEDLTTMCSWNILHHNNLLNNNVDVST